MTENENEIVDDNNADEGKQLSYKDALEIVSKYDKEFSRWLSKARGYYDDYEKEDLANEGKQNDTSSNSVFYSNVEILKPASYSATPNAQIMRRKTNSKQVYKDASEILQQGCAYFIDEANFDYALNQAVQDRLIVGRGTVWLDYLEEENSYFDNVSQTTVNDNKQDIRFDYVHYEDFGHTVVEKWEQVGQVWRTIYLNKKDFKASFPGAPYDDALFSHKSKNDDDSSNMSNRAAVIELWCKETRAQYYFCKANSDKKDDVDFLKVNRGFREYSGFFPCPMPLYGNLKNKSLIPKPDYDHYQPLVKKIESIDCQIDDLLSDIKVRGIFENSLKGIKEMLEGKNNFTGVDTLKAITENGGVQNLIQMYDFSPSIAALNVLYQARQFWEQKIHDITGISDIVRGVSDPNETAKAQHFKGQYAGQRLSVRQKAVQIFCRDLIVILAETLALYFSEKNLYEISEIIDLQTNDKNEASLRFMEAYKVLNNEGAVTYNINVETDSTIVANKEYQIAQRSEVIKTLQGLLGLSAQGGPQIVPMLGSLAKFMLAPYPQARALEGDIDKAITMAEKKMQEPPKPDPKVEANKAKQNIEQQKLNLQQQKQNQQHLLELENLKARQQELKARQQELETKIKADLVKPFVEASAEASAHIFTQGEAGEISNVFRGLSGGNV